jgi:hypothetical protein
LELALLQALGLGLAALWPLHVAARLLSLPGFGVTYRGRLNGRPFRWGRSAEANLAQHPGNGCDQQQTDEEPRDRAIADAFQRVSPFA